MTTEPTHRKLSAFYFYVCTVHSVYIFFISTNIAQYIYIYIYFIEMGGACGAYGGGERGAQGSGGET